MRFYQLEYISSAGIIVPHHEGADMSFPRVREWFASDREAVVRRLELFKAGKLRGKKDDAKIWPFDIPTDKRGLLAFLRAEAV
jgi:hypothetical protein